ncbi:MAG: dTDP-4-dehydrorhamnose reductase [Deltaproteobacteria bacterium]|jgi:dTDP-4-dehydrorhamnose reductase|nr:dTDP-4-dehydrorhamnose reductase [Deltaproteobacteria bacterium]
MKVLITGANGQLGWELQRARPNGFEIIALDIQEMDITDSPAVATVIQEYQPDLIINTAAYTAVDKAEEDKDKAFAINANGAAYIAKAAQGCRARLIHISTDFVFDGTKSQPYRPGDRTNPISVYGASKLQGELDVLAKTMNSALILRTGWLYSVHGSNFVKTMLKLMAEKEELRVIADQTGTPTWAGDFARAIYRFADIPDIKGIYHWADAGTASWFDFAVAIQEEAFKLGLLKIRIPVKPIRTEEYPTPAKRPAYSVLDKSSTWKTLGYKASHWRDSLRRMLEELKEVRSEV